MKKKNKHIDQIFSDLLKDQQINLSQDEMQEIFNQIKNPAIDELAKDLFNNFQMEVDEKMWQNVTAQTTAKKQNKLAALFSKFRIEPSPRDWDNLRTALGFLRFKKVLNNFFRICLTTILVFISFWINNTNSHNLNNLEPTNIPEHSNFNNFGNSPNCYNDFSITHVDITENDYFGQIIKATKSDTNIAIRSNKHSVIKLKPITDVDFSRVSQAEIEKSIFTHQKIKPINCKYIPFPKKQSPFFVSAGYSFGNGNRNITTENQLLKDIRNGSDRNFVTQSAGLYVGYQSKRLQISIGGEQENRNFESFYNHTVQIYDSIPVMDPNNQIIGYFYLNQRDSTYQTENRSQQTVVRIPLQLNYIIPIGIRWGLLMGGNFNFEHLKKTDNSLFINPNNGWLTSKQPRVLSERQNLWSAGFNTGLNYRINSNFELQSVLFINRQMNNKYETPNIKEIPYFWGVNLKLLYKL